MIVVYKVDRLTRSLADFAKLVELFDQHSVSFVSVTQSFNTILHARQHEVSHGCSPARNRGTQPARSLGSRQRGLR